MPNYRTEDIRNITFVGHSGSGKTSLTEALLVKSGKIGEAGTIERGTTTTDHDPLEKEYHAFTEPGRLASARVKEEACPLPAGCL